MGVVVVGGGGQLLRTTLHTISISLQNSFCESHTWRLIQAGRDLFNRLLSTKIQMGQTKNRSSKKSHKKTNKINIIATNFV